MRKRLWMLLTVALAACQPSPSDPQCEDTGLLLAFYNQRMVAQMGEAGSGTLATEAQWAVINGDGQLIGMGSQPGVIDHTDTDNAVIDYGDGATAISDPNRMRKVTRVTLVNTDNVTRSVTFYMERSPGGLKPLGPQFVIPAGGAVIYNGEDWKIYDATGQYGIAGPTGAKGDKGDTGATGSDGWSYVKLASDFGNSNATLTDVTGMNFSADANTNYEIEAFGHFTTAATTTGIGMAFTVPASATVAGVVWHPVSTTALGSSTTRASGAVTGNTAGVDAASPNIVPFTGKWVVKNANNAGTVQMQFRTEVNASAATLIGGSVWLKYRTIS